MEFLCKNTYEVKIFGKYKTKWNDYTRIVFKEEKLPTENKIKKVYNPKTLKQVATEKIKLYDKELAKLMINQYYFFDENLKNGFKINLESHNISHENSILTITPNFPVFGIEFGYINKIIKELSVIYARLINQNKFKNHSLFSASFYKKLLKKTKKIMKWNYI